MQLFISLVWATFTLCASALEDSLIYFPTKEPSGSSSRESSISPNTARLLLASRLGLSQYHEIGDADDTTLDTLSQFTTRKIFAQSEPQGKLLLVVDGAEAQGDFFESSKRNFTSLSIKDTRSGPTTNKLIKDLLRPSGHPNLPHEANLEIKYISSLKDLSALPPLIARATIILLPASHTTDKHTPSLFSSLHNQQPLSRRTPEDPDTETPLAPLEDSSSSSSSSSNTAAPSSSATALPPPKRGPQPLCHPTLPLLLSATQNCSNHGHPTFRTGGEGKADCYSCRCTSTLLRSGEGSHQKTIQWGGAACNKKDVSMAFWLVAGLTVFLVALVAWGVGLLMAVGGEELPSVIGAGVAGPRAQK